MTLHPANCRWLVITRDRDGRVVHEMNATAWIGTDRLDERIAVLRSGLREGETLDVPTVAHEAHKTARQRYAAAEAWWMGDTLGRPHPGRLSDYLELP